MDCLLDVPFPLGFLLDNQRFIGNVGWRLNAQSFNAASVKNNSVDNLTLFYAYTDSINDILGNTRDERQYHLLNADYLVCEDNQAAASPSHLRSSAIICEICGKTPSPPHSCSRVVISSSCSSDHAVIRAKAGSAGSQSFDKA